MARGFSLLELPASCAAQYRRLAADPARLSDTDGQFVHEDGTPDGAQGVILISPFEIVVDEDERFLTEWGRARDLIAAQRGYLGTRLRRSLGPADFRFVNIARWSSPLAFSKAVGQPGFQAVAPPSGSHPALYEVIRE